MTEDRPIVSITISRRRLVTAVAGVVLVAGAAVQVLTRAHIVSSHTVAAAAEYAVGFALLTLTVQWLLTRAERAPAAGAPAPGAAPPDGRPRWRVAAGRLAGTTEGFVAGVVVVGLAAAAWSMIVRGASVGETVREVLRGGAVLVGTAALLAASTDLFEGMEPDADEDDIDVRSLMAGRGERG